MAEHGGCGLATRMGYSGLRHGGRKLDYVGVVDADDLLGTTAIAECVRHLEDHPECGVAYTHYTDLYPDGTLRPGTRNEFQFDPQESLIQFNCFHFRLIRVSALEAAGGFSAQETAGDYDLVLRLGEVTKFRFVPILGYTHRVGVPGISTDRQFEQVGESMAAVKRAMRRRGLADLSLLARLRVDLKLLDQQGNPVSPVDLPPLELKESLSPEWLA
jgi:hypothetical protein